MNVRSNAAAAGFLLLTLAVPTIAHAQIPDDAVPLKTVISETNTFRTEYAEYYNKKDVTALMGMYATDAIVIPEDGMTLIGAAAIKEYFTKNAPTFPHIVLKSDSLASYGATAVIVGTLTAHPQAGGEVISHYLAVLRRHLGHWKIVRVAVVPVAK